MFEKKEIPVVKRPYVSPVIQIYGNIRTITQAVGNQGKNDAGQNPPQKTSLL